MAGIYIHIPFADKHATIVTFTFGQSDVKPQLIKAIVKELTLQKDGFAGRSYRQLFTRWRNAFAACSWF